MNFKIIVLAIGLSVALMGCGEQLPVASSVNCSGAGMQSSLAEFKDEAAREAFLKGCEAFK